MATGWCLGLLVAWGTIGMAPILLALWDIWNEDPLKSLGMLIVPVSIILTLRVWRQMGWELQGCWWGLLPVALALGLSDFRHLVDWRIFIGSANLNLLSPKVSLYLFGSGFVLLFAGARVWRQAWFPLALLLCAQPMPYFFLIYGDVPLQDISAHIARSFAILIGFPPTSRDLLRLMFTPDFGMFIAPGCDGVRGALTMGYLAMITGYLKKVSFPRWISYTGGGVLLGYLFNLIRLCALVVYYRFAAGHPAMEHFAKWADYLIGGCLFLVASLLFLWIVFRGDQPQATTSDPQPAATPKAGNGLWFRWQAAAFALLALLFVLPGLRAIRSYRKPFSAEVRAGAITPAHLDALMPKHLGGYTLNRAWQELSNGRIQIESGAYDQAARDEATLGVWIPAVAHSVHISWIARGEDPILRSDRTFITEPGRPTTFDMAFYSNGINDTIAGNAFCTPTGCVPSPERVYEGMRLTIDPPDFETAGRRSVSIFFRIDRPHVAADQARVFQQLETEAKEFVAGVDFSDISRRFQ